MPNVILSASRNAGKAAAESSASRPRPQPVRSPIRPPLQPQSKSKQLSANPSVKVVKPSATTVKGQTAPTRQVREIRKLPEEVFENFTYDEIRRLGRRFRKLDSDHSGTITLKEFLTVPEISRNVLANRIVEVLDGNHNGEVDFREFVLGMSQFSSKSNVEGRLRFAFRIYDKDGNGFITNGGLFHVLKGMVGNNMADVDLQQIVDHTFMIGDINQDGKISFEEFAKIVGSNPAPTSMVLKNI